MMIGETESAFIPVSTERRKPFATLMMLLTGYTVSLSNFVTGAALGARTDFRTLLLSVLAGNAILAFVAATLGILGAKSGKSTLMLARNFLGRRASGVLAFLIALTAVNWIGVNAAAFSEMLPAAFPWWPFPAAITAILAVTLWAQSAIRGIRGMELISRAGAPAALLLVVVSFAVLSRRAGFYAVRSFVPSGASLDFAVGSTSVIGAWVMGCIIVPDITRYARRPLHAAVAAPAAVFLGLALPEIAGALTAQAVGTPDFVSAASALGLALLLFICSVFCVWTTQDNNIYSASLSLQALFDGENAKPIPLTHLALTLAALAALFAASGAIRYLLPIVQALSIVLAPVPGLMLSEQWLVRSSKAGQNINILGLISWAAASFLSWLALRHSFAIPALCGMAAAFVLYALLSKCLDKMFNPHALGGAE